MADTQEVGSLSFPSYIDITKFKYYKNHLENSLRGFYLRGEFSAFQIFFCYSMKMPLLSV